MGFETIAGQSGGKIFSSKMAVGEVVEGYFQGFLLGKFGDIIVLEKDDGSQIEIYASGSLKYLKQDHAKDLHGGVLTRITKTFQGIGKNGKPTSRFSVAQDKEKVKGQARLIQETPPMTNSLGTSSQTDVEARVAALRAAKEKTQVGQR